MAATSRFPDWRFGFAAVVMGLLAVLPACSAVKEPEPWIYTSNASLNGQPLRMVLDTGMRNVYLMDGAARRAGLQLTEDATSAPADLAQHIPSLASPANFTVNNRSITAEFLVDTSGRFNSSKIDGIIGWPAVRNNILVFDSSKHQLRGVDAVPPEAATWMKLKIPLSNILNVEMPLPEGRTGTVGIDTGSLYGVAMPPSQYAAWRAAHPKAPSRTTTYYTPGAGEVKTEEAWADEINLGGLTLTDVPIRAANPVEMRGMDNFVCTLGMYVLMRMDLVVDGKNGFAYLHPKPSPGPAYFGITRPAVENDTAKDTAAVQEWTTADSVLVDDACLRAQALYFKGAQKFDAKDFDASLALCTQAIALDPTYADAYLFRAFLLENKGDHAAAIADASRAMEFDLVSPDQAYYERALAEYKIADLDAALADLNRAIEINDRIANYFTMRGIIRAGNRDLAGAFSDFNRSVELDPQNVLNLDNRATAEMMQGNLDGAGADYTRILELDPKNSKAVSGLKAIQQQKAARPAVTGLSP